MAKNILAFFGLIFLTLVILAGVLGMGFYYDKIGLIQLPDAFHQTLSSLTDAGTVVVKVQDTTGIQHLQWSNPLEGLPTATQTPVPAPTETPIPPLDPEVYQSQVMSRLKTYASALQDWLKANDALAANNDLLNDPTWQAKMSAILENVRASGQQLADVGPAPTQYQGLDGWLKKAGNDAENLQQNYQKAMQTHASQDFIAASQSFTQIKDALSQAAQEMVNAGWVLQ